MENNLDRNLSKPKKPLWTIPWGYAESFIVAFGLLLAGFAIEYATSGAGINPVGWSYNAYIGIVFINILVLVHHYNHKHLFVKWISGVSAAISAISVFTFLILLMGFIPQFNNNSSVFLKKTGLEHINRSWPYLLIQIYFLTVLGFVILKRSVPFRSKNIGFLLNHAGLWIIIFSATLGSGDLKRLTMDLYEQKTVFQATDTKNRVHELPVALKLVKFDIEEYNPKLIIADKTSGAVIEEKGKTLSVAEKGFEGKINDWNIKILDFIQYAQSKDTFYIPINDIGSSPAAFVKITNSNTGIVSEGWICSGSSFMSPRFLDLSDNKVLAMLRPEAKKFSSQVEVFTKNGFHDTVSIEVNKPYKVENWKIYQIGYDEQMGKWSQLSIVELVSDPWLPLIYTGIFLLLAGSTYLFWIGKGKKHKTPYDAEF
jgi:hypothetical protein